MLVPRQLVQKRSDLTANLCLHIYNGDRIAIVLSSLCIRQEEMQLEYQNMILIKMYFQAAGRTPPPGSASTRSPLAAPAASTPPALLAARFTIVVVIEIFKIDYLKNSV